MPDAKDYEHAPMKKRYAIGLFIAGCAVGLIFEMYIGIGIILHPMGIRRDLSASDTANRIEVPFSALANKRVMVALAFGQSNSANFGESRKVAGPNVYNFYHGKIYRAADPMLGADGKGGSVWTRLGDKIIARKLYDAVVFIPIGVTATSIEEWQPGGDMHHRILDAIADAKASGLTITHLLWHQGESDARHPALYRERFLAMLKSIRQHGVDAPIYVSVASFGYGGRSNPVLEAEQRRLVDPGRKILAGPDTDQLDGFYRYDGTHFTGEGLEREAELWMAALAH